MKVNLNGATAVITGASSGIGREFAKALAAKGCRLILVARREERMRELAAGLGVPCEVLPADLSRAEECNRIVGTIAGQGASVLINCAGFGLLGATTDQSLDEELNMIDLNIRAVHILTRKFLELRAEAGTGAILNVASCAGLLPAGPYLNTYYATKAYVASFTQGLAQELRDCKSGIYVGALCPGPVYTEFTKAAHGKEWPSAKTPEEIVDYAIRKMEKGKTLIVPGAAVRAGLFGSRLIPRRWTAKLIGTGQKGRVDTENGD
ncbi:MAG: SDR family oxidoreductase [Lachnospiraceae bacterium]|nr:SDR family oxidoreductase [Lachnospiraceae bacterium]